MKQMGEMMMFLDGELEPKASFEQRRIELKKRLLATQEKCLQKLKARRVVLERHESAGALLYVNTYNSAPLLPRKAALASRTAVRLSIVLDCVITIIMGTATAAAVWPRYYPRVLSTRHASCFRSPPS